MKAFASILAAALALSGCAAGGPGFGQDNRPFTSTEGGILIGAASGAVIGAIAYKENRSRGAVIGAIGGGLAGGAVGAYMDKQKQDLEKALAQEIQAGQARIDKMPNDVRAHHHDQPDRVRDRLERHQARLQQHHGQGGRRGRALRQDHADRRRPYRQRRHATTTTRSSRSGARTRWRSTSSRSASTACASPWRARARRSRSPSNANESGRQAEPPRRDLRRAGGTGITMAGKEAAGTREGPHQLRRRRLLALPAPLVREEHGLLGRDARPARSSASPTRAAASTTATATSPS